MAPVRRGFVAPLQARVLAVRLDRELATGADPVGNRARALRAAALVERRARIVVADGLCAAIDRGSDGPRAAWSSAIPVQRAQVRDATGELILLIEHLRDGARPVRAQGVALARRLLIDGTGPLYAATPRGTLRLAVWTAADRLRDGP